MSTGRPRQRRGFVPVDVLTCGSFIDTIVIRMPRLMERDEFSKLEKSLENSSRQIVLVKWKRPDGYFVLGLEIHQPSRAALEFLKTTLTPYRITEVHIALDLVTRTKLDASLLQRYVEARFVKSGRPPKLTYWPMKKGTDIESESVYFDRGTRRGNEAVLYSDNASKPFPDSPCLHVEWRLMGAKEIRKTDLDKPQNLLDLKHADFWDKRLRLWSPPSRSKLIQKRKKQLGKIPGLTTDESRAVRTVEAVIRASSGATANVIASDMLHVLNASKAIVGDRPSQLFVVERHDWMLPPQGNAMWDCLEPNSVGMKGASPVKIDEAIAQ